jgi:transketolase
LTNWINKPATLSNSGNIPCRKVFTGTLLELAREDRDIIVVTTDARGSVTLTDFAEQLPEQFIELGIAEQNAIGISAGLAASGKKVFVCGPASFYSSRNVEQTKIDLAYSENPVKVIGVSGGVSYGALGSTHHSLNDIAIMRTFPGMTVLLPCDNRQTERMTRALAGYGHPVYVRMGRGAVPDVYPDDQPPFTIGKANILLEGGDLSIIAAGETVFHALRAGLVLKEKGLNTRIIDMHTVKPLDEDTILKAARETGMIITVEEHHIAGGLGSAVAETVTAHVPVPVRMIGFPDEFAVHGRPMELFQHYGLDAEGIVRTALEMIKTKKPDTDGR